MRVSMYRYGLYIRGGYTEREVGKAIRMVLDNQKILSRNEIFVITKHWRKFHGYENTLKCLNLSLKRLQLDYVDLWLMHWPGRAYSTMNRRKEVLQKDGPWAYSTSKADEMPNLRSQTWLAMEDALKNGLVRSTGVSNFTVKHLQTLKRTAKIWPPAVNQVEFHPLYQQEDLREYCRQEIIILQAYASLRGQDASKAKWKELLGEVEQEKNVEINREDNLLRRKKKLKVIPATLLSHRVVTSLARSTGRPPAQILLRWALQHNCAVIHKTSDRKRCLKNMQIFNFELSEEQMNVLDKLRQNVPESSSGRLCWRNDPLRMLEFD
mmetsp:Transcript_16907/g.38035  ORF Transcript_16907/g.38035 Transcript_16907/m.38035 type:complete len:323 (-) Transcript_16907:1895-2863(-)